MTDSVIPVILSELQKQYGITYEDAIQLQDENGDSHNFYVASIRGAKVLFDTDGQPWMSEAEIVKGMNISKQAVNVALQRLMDSDLSEAICAVNSLLTPNQRGELRTVNFYDEETVAAIITRGHNQSPESLAFLAERKAIIKTFRKYLHEYSMYTNEQNQALKQCLEGLQFALSEEQKEKRALVWKVDEYEYQEERKHRDDDLYDWNDL